MRILSIFFLTALFFSGCASLYSHGPSAIVESPEFASLSRKGKTFVAQTEPSLDHRLVDDASVRPLDVNSVPELRAAGSGTGGLEFLTMSRWQWGIAVDSVGLVRRSIGARGMVKYLLIGEGQDRWEENPHSLSAYGHVTGGYSDASGDQDGLFGKGGYPWNASSRLFGLNAGISYGYRLAPRHMVFAGAAYHNYEINADVHQERSATGDYPEASAKLPRTEGNSKTLAVGYHFGRKNKLTLMGSYSENNWGGQEVPQWFTSVGWRILSFDPGAEEVL